MPWPIESSHTTPEAQPGIVVRKSNVLSSLYLQPTFLSESQWHWHHLHLLNALPPQKCLVRNLAQELCHVTWILTQPKCFPSLNRSNRRNRFQRHLGILGIWFCRNEGFFNALDLNLRISETPTEICQSATACCRWGSNSQTRSKCLRSEAMHKTRWFDKDDLTLIKSSNPASKCVDLHLGKLWPGVPPLWQPRWLSPRVSWPLWPSHVLPF